MAGILRGDLRLKGGKRLSRKWVDSMVYALWQDLCTFTEWKLGDKYLLTTKEMTQVRCF